MRHFSISIKNKFKYFSILKTRQIALSFYCSIPIIFLLLYLNLEFAISLGQPISSNAIQKYFSLIILVSVSCLFSFFFVFFTQESVVKPARKKEHLLHIVLNRLHICCSSQRPIFHFHHLRIIIGYVPDYGQQTKTQLKLKL